MVISITDTVYIHGFFASLGICGMIIPLWMLVNAVVFGPAVK